MTTDLIGLAIQIPVVGIFVWFSLQLIQYFLSAIARRDADWREFLRQQQIASSDAIREVAARFTDAIQTLDQNVKDLKNKIE